MAGSGGSNPFSSFAAGKRNTTNTNGGGGWLTTKKRGRDDAKIRRDAKQAADARKNQRAKKKPPTKNNNKAAAKKKKKKKLYCDESESEDSFIVQDDDEISYDEESLEEEELILDKKRKKQKKKKPQSRRINHTVKDVVHVDSSSEEELIIEKKQTKKRKSLNETASLTSSGSSEDEDASFLPKSATLLEQKRTSKPILPRLGNNAKKRAINLCASEDDDDSSSDDDSLLNHKWNETKPTKSKYFVAKTTSLSRVGLSDESEIEDDDEATAVAKAIQASLQESSPEMIKKQQHKRLKKKSTKKKKKKRQRVVAELSPVVASQETTSQEEPISLLDDSEEEEGEELQDEEEVDVYVAQDDDVGAKEARSVLEAANKLSAQVLATMMAWCSKDDNDTTTNGSSSVVPQGMICDGALSLQNATTSTSESWISNDEMKRVCPMVNLANYQLVGVNWMALLHGMTYNTTNSTEKPLSVNGVLADEMGLGKTVQTICFLAWLKQHNRSKRNSDNGTEEGAADRPHIIVVPASVLTNWQREFEKFCPDMTVVKYHGSMVERDEIQQRLRQSLPDAHNKLPLDVVLTTFSYFSSEKSTDRNFLRRFRFDYLVVDEAHCLKNPKGMRYCNLNKFSTSHRLLLTGTPVQNSPKELMSLLCFLMPLFSSPSSSFDDYDDSNKHDGGESMLQHFVSLETGSDAKASAYKKLKQLFAPFVLRRKKAEVLAQIMPPKIRKLEKLPFDGKTRMLYDSILEKHLSRKNGGNGSDDASAKQHLFTQLRKAANHPLLLRTRHLSEEAVDDLSHHLYRMGYFGRDATLTVRHVRQELENFSDFDIHGAALTLMEESPGRSSVLEKYTLGVDDLFCSPKFVRLRTLLPELIKEGHRVLVYSQWTRCMDLLGCLMDALELKYLRLDGSTAVNERQALIDEFNQDDSIPIFLLSTRAGGMGINLTAADTCLIHDVDFNPFNDLQAEDRCHRLGQTKEVTVIKMVTEGTVDMDIYNMQQEKVKMNAAILESSSAKTKATETEEMNSILDNAFHRFLSSPKPKGKKSEQKEEGTLV